MPEKFFVDEGHVPRMLENPPPERSSKSRSKPKGQKLSGIAGSPAYVAPEVLSGSYSEKVDIWGAGVLLHALLLGILPFQGDSLEAVFDAIRTVELDFHSGLWASMSELARDLIGRMLTRDVARRITADEVLRHPWIVFYTDSNARGLAVKFGSKNNGTMCKAELKRRVSRGCVLESGTASSSSESSDELEDHGFIDVLAVALSQVRISEPKRTRLCAPASPMRQECSSNLKANLCTAF
ncbi:hypothetical protein Taro_034198 [Colocasia esculenta]|uniref:Protein kinase domain-containing protein n=1 Tax=Colocasia esculenta TaxID=4460 RepID=A0A843W3F4_COLES|nr:hypothetical protein [Colocasia esculenta]